MRPFKRGLFSIVSLTIVLIFGLYLMQKKLIFLPTTLAEGYKYTFFEPFEEFFLETDDGARLNAVHFKVENPKGVILYYHGNAGDLSRWGEIASGLIKYGYDVLLMDYRSYGKSTGVINEKKLFEDAQLFYKYALKNYPEENIVVFGRSLGTSLATYVSSQNNPKKLILETPFYNLKDVVKTRFPFLPVKFLLKYRFMSNSYMKTVGCPVFIFHGTQDRIVPFTSAKKLAALVAKDRLTFVRIEGGDHNNLINYTEYGEGIDKALR